MKKKITGIVLALIALAVVGFVASTQKAKTQAVMVAKHDLPAGYTITEEDLQSAELPSKTIPEGAVGEEDQGILVGQTLAVARTAQDVILPAHLGEADLDLQADERALGIEVTDSAGLAGLLKAGDHVGVSAVINADCIYTKVVAEGLRVLYVSPEFLAAEPEVEREETTAFGGGGSSIRQPREDRGVVVLAVPVDQQAIAYDFSAFGVESDTRMINVIELLSVLDHSSRVELSLFMEPAEGKRFVTAGLCLSDLALHPQPSPTPGETAVPGEEINPEGDE
jgi:pilus assembly protein CpaB